LRTRDYRKAQRSVGPFLIFIVINFLIFNPFFSTFYENGSLLSYFGCGKNISVENFTFMRILGKSHGVRLIIENYYDDY
jgi:hypothetical protein